jgi:beta-lactamase regulating signal transducer with metallopeptidase domain
METTGLFWDFMTTQSVQVALVFGVVAGVNWMLRNRSAHIRYLLWLVVLVKCVTPSIVTFSLPVLPGETTLQMPSAVRSETMDCGPVEPAVVRREAAEKTAVPEQTQTNLATVEPLAAAQTERPGLSKALLWAILWAAGAACYLLWALGRAMLLGRRLKHSRRPLPAELMVKQIETLARLWDYPGGFKVWLMDGIGQPFVWGLWRGAIYLPTRFQSIQTDRQKAIVIHEMAHVVRLDAFVNLLQILIQGLFWFHPLVWLANRVIRQEREKCCDEIAVARLGTAPREYGSAIVDTLLQEVQTTLAIPTLAVAGPVKNIEDRIKTIMQPGRRFLRRPSTVAMLIIGLLAAVVVPTTIALTHKVTPPDYVLSGTVMDAQNGQPIAGAIVLDDGYGPQPYQKGITDDAGKFEYKSWNEEHNITARADGYHSQTMVFTTAPFDNSRVLHFKLSKAAPGEAAVLSRDEPGNFK